MYSYHRSNLWSAFGVVLALVQSAQSMIITNYCLPIRCLSYIFPKENTIVLLLHIQPSLYRKTTRRGQHLLPDWSDVRRGQTAINFEISASHVTALIRSQEESGLRYLDGLSKSAHGQMHQTAVALLWSVEEIHQKGRFKWTWTNSVEPYALTSVDHGQFTGHGKDRTFGSSIRELGRCGTHRGHKARSIDNTSTGM